MADCTALENPSFLNLEAGMQSVKLRYLSSRGAGKEYMIFNLLYLFSGSYKTHSWLIAQP